MRTLLLVTAAVLATAAPAAAGGFATAGITPLPRGDSAVWEPTVTIRAHGVTPVDGLEPALTIRDVDTGEMRRFSGRPVGSGGEYRFRVEFPHAGTWSYTVSDGYAGQVHTFAPVAIAAAPAGPGGGTMPWTVGGGAAILGALALLVLAGRRGRPPRAAAPAAS